MHRLQYGISASLCTPGLPLSLSPTPHKDNYSFKKKQTQKKDEITRKDYHFLDYQIVEMVYNHAYNEYLAMFVISKLKKKKDKVTFRLKKGQTATRIYYCYKSLNCFTRFGVALRGSYNTTSEKGITVFR